MLPQPENVISGTYAPLSRPLFIYVNVKSLKKPSVRKFVEFYAENSGRFAEQVDYVALPKEIADRSKEFIKKRHAGTVFVSKDGKKREGALKEFYKKEHLLDTK